MGAPLRRPPVTKEAWNTYVDADPLDPPPRLALSEFRALTPRDRDAYVATCRRHHGALGPYAIGRTRQIMDGALALLDANDELAEDRVRPGAAIDGEPNLGKTTLLRLIGRRYQRQLRARYGLETEQGHEYVPVCYVTLPRESTIKGINEKIAAFYNLPLPQKQSVSRLTQRIIEVMWLCGTSLVLIDDLHYVNPRDLHGKALNDHLKHLMNEVAATFLFAGVGLEHAGIFREGRSQADARFSQMAERLRRFRVEHLDPATREGLADWRALLAAIQHDLRLLGPYRLTTNAMADYLYARSQGSIGKLIDLIRLGCELSIGHDSTTRARPAGLSREVLDQVQLSRGAEALRPRTRRPQRSARAATRRKAAVL